MDERTIENLLKKIPIVREIFLGCYPVDRLVYRSKFPFEFICNFDEHDEPGSHWTLIFVKSPFEVEYFDSYAEEPPYLITKYLEKFKFVYKNKTPLQNLFATSCGSYCIYFAILKSLGFSMQQIVDYLKKINNIDDYVVKFANKLLEK